MNVGNRFPPVAALFAMLTIASACGPSQRASTTPAPAPADAGKVDPEDPKAGLNTQRPDSIKDVKPEAGGQTPR